MIKRASLSDYIKDTVSSYTGFPSGLGRTPAGAGWDPAVNKDAAVFVPYTILNPQNANHAEGPISESQADWWLPYLVTAYGVDPHQTEDLADTCRTAIGELQQQDLRLGNDTYFVQQVRVDSIGGLVRADVLDPSYWVQSDTVSIWVSKES